MFGLITKAAHERALEIAKREAFASGHADGRATAPKPVSQQPKIDSLLGQIDGMKYTVGNLNSQIADLKPDAIKHRERIAKNREYDAKRRTKSPTKQGVAKAAPGKVGK